jgi:lysozyme
MRTSEQGIELIKEFEGFRSEAYKCPAGVWTIGYGDTIHVQEGDTITEEKADMLLRARIVNYEVAVEHHVTVPMNQNQYDALVSLCYNIGPGNFHKSSVVSFLNQGHKRKAGQSFLLWNKATVDGVLTVLPGLVKRRQREMTLFLTDPEAT